MSGVPFQEPPGGGQRFELDLEGSVLADGLIAITVEIPDDQRLPENWRKSPGVVLIFGQGKSQLQPIVVGGKTDAELDELVRLVRDAVESAKDARGPGPRKAKCPSCGRQIFGKVARRGGCLSCFPELGEDEELLGDDAEISDDLEHVAEGEGPLPPIPESAYSPGAVKLDACSRCNGAGSVMDGRNVAHSCPECGGAP